MKALSEFVEEARERYKVTSRPNVTIHSVDSVNAFRFYIITRESHLFVAYVRSQLCVEQR